MDSNQQQNQQQTMSPSNRVQQGVLKVRILSPKKLIFEGEVKALSSANSAGKFDILAEHANFITLVKNTPISVLQQSNEQLNFTFNLAIILAINNQVTVYADIGNLGQIPGMAVK